MTPEPHETDQTHSMGSGMSGSVKRKSGKVKKKWLLVKKSQQKVNIFWLFVDFSWLKAIFFDLPDFLFYKVSGVAYSGGLSSAPVSNVAQTATDIEGEQRG